jgi:hypothetical protein
VWLVPTCLTGDPSVTNVFLPSFGPLTCREKCTNAMELLCAMGLCQDVLPASSPSSCPLGKCPTAPSVGNHAISTLIQNSHVIQCSTAVMMGVHTRMGCDSLLLELSIDLLRKICCIADTHDLGDKGVWGMCCVKFLGDVCYEGAVSQIDILLSLLH